MDTRAPKAPNTVRLVIADPKSCHFGLYKIQKEIVEDLLGMERKAIFYVQCFPSTGYYDISFWNKEDVQTLMLQKSEKVDDPLFKWNHLSV